MPQQRLTTQHTEYRPQTTTEASSNTPSLLLSFFRSSSFTPPTSSGQLNDRPTDRTSAIVSSVRPAKCKKSFDILMKTTCRKRLVIVQHDDDDTPAAALSSTPSFRLHIIPNEPSFLLYLHLLLLLLRNDFPFLLPRCCCCSSESPTQGKYFTTPSAPQFPAPFSALISHSELLLAFRVTKATSYFSAFLLLVFPQEAQETAVATGTTPILLLSLLLLQRIVFNESSSSFSSFVVSFWSGHLSA